MPRDILILALVLCCRVTSFATCDEKSISTTEIDNPEYYPYIIFLSPGEDISNDLSVSDDYHGYFYRVVVAKSEIYKSIIIEKITYGIEGSNSKLQSARAINVDDFADKFDYSMHLIVYFEFISWLSPTSFVCKIHGDFFEVSEIDKPVINITKVE